MKLSISSKTLLLWLAMHGLQCNQVSSFQPAASSVQRTPNRIHNRQPLQRSIRTTTPPEQTKHSETRTTALSALPSSVVALTSTLPLAQLGSLSVLAFVVCIHEAGHFLAARSMGINVQEFSVGVGPKIAGFTRSTTSSSTTTKDGETMSDAKKTGNDDEEKEGIDFNLRAIPLGGYVRFPENYNATLAFQLEKEADSKRREIERLVEEENFTIEDAVKKITKESEGNQKTVSSPWWQFNKKIETKKESVQSIIVENDGSVTVPPIDYYQDPNLLQNRPWSERAIVLVGGVVFNIILALLCYFGELTVGSGISKPIFDQGAIVTSAPRVDGASAGVLDRGDIILAMNGKPLSTTSPSFIASQDAISTFISDIRATAPGESLSLSILKAGTSSPTEVSVKPRPIDTTSGPLSIGVMIGPNFKNVEKVKATSIGDAIVKSTSEVTELTSQTARSILTFLGGILSEKGAPAGQSLSGPIGVIRSGSDVVAKNDFNAVVGFVAAISINLAVVNSLPLPALDGGQLMFVLAEAATGRKIDQRTQEAINSLAVLFLLVVTFSTTIGDLSAIGR